MESKAEDGRRGLASLDLLNSLLGFVSRIVLLNFRKSKIKFT